jgi:hypothetical protein
MNSTLSSSKSRFVNGGKIQAVIFLAALFLMLGSCTSDNAPWYYDSDYTRELVLDVSGDHSESVASVDVVQIYMVACKQNSVLPLKSLRRERLLRDLRSKEEIKVFFGSLRKIADSDGERKVCFSAESDRCFHLVAFDRTLLRVAYMRYRLSVREKQNCGTVLSLADEGVFCNTEPPEALVRTVNSTSKYTTPR